jgi:pilus assembly protein CpaE
MARVLARNGTAVAYRLSMIVSFLGTKGGTGTTTLAVNGAADIRRLTGRPTVVVDLKNGPGDVALFLGLRPRHSFLTALDHLGWIDPPSLSRYVVEHECGLHVLAAGDEFGRPAPRDADAVEQTLRALNAIYDYVILDCGTSLMMPTAGALQLSDAILLVANPDVPCLRNLQRLIDAVKTAGVPGERLHIILNRASEFGVLSTAQIERVLGLNISFSVNSDYRTVASAVNSGVPVSALRASELNAQLDTIARALVSAHDLTVERGARHRSGVRVAAP